MAISVDVRFLCREVVGSARNGEYLLPEGSTLEDLMNFAAEENKSFVNDYMNNVLFILNGKLAEADKVLKDADQVKVAGIVYGG